MNPTKHIIRTYSAGVHYGEIVRRDGGEVTLRNARRLWYWSGAASLSQMAVEGVSKPKECRFSVRVPEITILGAIELIACTDAAVANIEAVHEWRA